jgi:hypothetical protein
VYQEVSGIRAAIAAEQYEEALRLWNAYAVELREELCQRDLSGAALKEVLELVAWSRMSLLCARAHAAHQLNQLHAARAYGTSSGPEAGLLRLSC